MKIPKYVDKLIEKRMKDGFDILVKER